MSTEKIAEFIANTGYKKIPGEAIAIAKMCILDGFGVALAGTQEPAGKIITEYVEHIGGKPVSGVIGGGFKTSSQLAALANGTLAHALDYDDHAITWMGHPTIVLLPSILALAERDHLSGQQILEAYSVGWDVGSKLCSELSIGLFEQGWHPTATVGTLAATAACANLLKLSSKQIRVALGIAASEAAGLRSNFGTDTKPFHAGKAASNAISAVSLAQKGFTASEAILEGPIGFCSVFAKKECNLNALAERLGSPFDILTSYSIKPYPSCGLTHRCIDAMLHLVKEHQLTPDLVAEVECYTPALARDILLYSRPQTGLQGKFSLEYCTAAALIDREVSLRQFMDEKVQSPIAQGLIPKVKVSYVEGAEGESLLNIPQAVKVKLLDGPEHFYEVRWPKGYSYNPMTWEEVANKFRDCTEGVLSPGEIDQIIELLSKLESLTSISELMAVASKTKP